MTPDFIIIGAPRCGTTYLSNNLAEHPQIFLGLGEENYSAGDVHFFDIASQPGKNNFAKGMEWYTELFSDAKPGQLIGEKTADYLSDPNAAKLIYNTLGKIKLIAVVRDPLLRAWSHYNHSRHKLPLKTRFDYLLQHPSRDKLGILETGKYFSLLQPFFEHFGKNQLMVVVQDDLESVPVETLHRVCQFLGVDPSFEFPHKADRVNSSSNSLISHITARVGRWLKHNFPDLYKYLINGPVSDIMTKSILTLRGKSINKARPENLHLSLENRVKLKAYYQEDTRKLGKYLNRNLEKLWWDD